MVQLAAQFVPLKTAGRNYGISIHEFSIFAKDNFEGQIERACERELNSRSLPVLVCNAPRLYLRVKRSRFFNFEYSSARG